MNKKLYNEFIEFYTPTQEQLERVFSDEEAKLICLNYECRVQMDLFNPVNDYVRKFKRKGKLQKWSMQKLQKKIIERIKRRTEKHGGDIYSESEIEKFEYEQWAQRKNYYIRWLEYYEYQQKEKTNQENDGNTEYSSEADLVLEDPSSCDKAAEQTVINNDQWSTPDLNNNDDNNTDSGGIYRQFMEFNTESLEINTEDIQSENLASSKEDLTGIEASNIESDKFLQYSTGGSLLREIEASTSMSFSQFAENVSSKSTQQLLN